MIAAIPATAVATAAQAFLARFEGLRDRLPGEHHARAAAARAFRAAGLPGPRDEAWKYTSLRPLTEAAFQEPLTSVAPPPDLLARLPALGVPRLVFLDGRWCEEISVLPDAAAFSRFATTPDFGRLARPETQPLVALNTMMAQDGAMLSVPDDADGGTILLASLAADLHGRPVAFHPRHAIRLGAGARLMLIEIAAGEGVYLHNPVTELLVGAGAALTHIRLQDEDARAFHLATIHLELAGEARYEATWLGTGARLARTELHARLRGTRSDLRLTAAQLARSSQHTDLTSVIAHDAPACSSRQLVRSVLAGHARGVFQGRIEVARAAQKTDGYQMNQTLLLSPEAESDSKPELEIFADDVKCSHGATVGELDAEQLFYLRSRGIAKDDARAILVRAFLDEVLQTATDDGARGLLEAAVQNWPMKDAA